MTTAEIAEKMMVYSQGNRHDINHFMKVYAYAGTIGRLEGLDAETQTILETAALVHDIACPLCREKYGNTNGKWQELEGPALVREFLSDSGLSPAAVERIAWLVGHHHTFQAVEGMDYQILLEADFLVNADESGSPRETIENMRERVFRTESGLHLLDALYPLE